MISAYSGKPGGNSFRTRFGSLSMKWGNPAAIGVLFDNEEEPDSSECGYPLRQPALWLLESVSLESLGSFSRMLS